MIVITTVHRSSAARSRFLVVGGVVGVVVGVWFTARQWGAAGVSVGLAVALAAFPAAVDARTSRIPDRLLVWSTVPTLTVIAHEFGNRRGASTALAVILGVLGFAGPIFIVHLVSPASLGFGDVKLAAALGAALGLIDPGLGLFALCIASGVTCVAGLVGRRQALAFGPGLVVGAVVALAVAGQLGQEALPWR